MLSVGVLIDLYRANAAGGQVKCWERLAEAACSVPAELDLTVHFLGDHHGVDRLAPNVRYVAHKPVLGTSSLRFLRGLPKTDLAVRNRHIIPYLARYDVIHVTHPHFAFGRTALRFASEFNVPLVNSVHTDVPSYTTIYMAHLIESCVGKGQARDFLVDRLKLGERRAAAMRRKLRDYWGCCDHVLVSHAGDHREVARVLPPERISFLRRGVEHEQFRPALRSRTRLQERYGVPPDKVLLLFVGRLDDCKSSMTAAHAARNLVDAGAPVHIMFVGRGPRAHEIEELLGPAATFTGTVPQETLAWLYASADLLVFPSRTETYGNVVVEAQASGLPVVVSSHGGAGERVQRPGEDGVRVDEDDPALWAQEISDLLARPERLAVMRAALSEHATSVPTWTDVLVEDLLPVWRSVVGREPRKESQSRRAEAVGGR